MLIENLNSAERIHQIRLSNPLNQIPIDISINNLNIDNKIVNSLFENIQDEFDNSLNRLNIQNFSSDISPTDHDYRSKLFKLFFLTILWGRGLGDNRWKPIFNDNEFPDIMEHIANSINILLPNDNLSIRRAFQNMNNIKGLGISFISKFFYSRK